MGMGRLEPCALSPGSSTSLSICPPAPASLILHGYYSVRLFPDSVLIVTVDGCRAGGNQQVAPISVAVSAEHAGGEHPERGMTPERLALIPSAP